MFEGRRGSKIFSRGGGRIFKKILKILVDLLFRSFKLIFQALSMKRVKRPCFGQNFCPAGKSLKKQAKKGFFWHFLEIYDFSARAHPSKLVYIGAKGALKKVWGPSAKNGYLKVVQRGDSLGRQGVESLPTLNPPLFEGLSLNSSDTHTHKDTRP